MKQEAETELKRVFRVSMTVLSRIHTLCFHFLVELLPEGKFAAWASARADSRVRQRAPIAAAEPRC